MTYLDPPYPSTTKLNGYKPEVDWQRIKSSKSWRLCPQHYRSSLLRLWLESWNEVPSGSYEDDDELIASAIDMDVDEFIEVKRFLLRGWQRCSDGRLYHPVISEMVGQMINKRSSSAQRTVAYRSKLAAMLARDGDACVYCGSTKYLGTDLVVPKSLGGDSQDDNVVCACRSCADRKKDKMPEDAGLEFISVVARNRAAGAVERLFCNALQDPGPDSGGVGASKRIFRDTSQSLSNASQTRSDTSQGVFCNVLQKNGAGRGPDFLGQNAKTSPKVEKDSQKAPDENEGCNASQTRSNALQTQSDASQGRCNVSDTHRKQETGNRKQEQEQEQEKEQEQEHVRPRHENALAVTKLLDHLNAKAGTNFRSTVNGKRTKAAEMAEARITDYGLETMLAVVDHKAAQWLSDPKMHVYLRPSTLFLKSKCDEYAAQLGTAAKIHDFHNPTSKQARIEQNAANLLLRYGIGNTIAGEFVHEA